MEPKKKQTRKSVPRPNSGRRAVDGATDLVKVGIRLTPEQHEWVQKHGQHALRQLVQARIEAERNESYLFIVELGNGNWHTITRSGSEAKEAADEWNKWSPGGARKFKALVIEQATGSDDSMEVQRAVSGLNYGAMTKHQKGYWRKQCERHGIPVPEGLKD